MNSSTAICAAKPHSDPHLTDVWFELLKHTALPAGAVVTKHDIGCDGHPSHLYLLQTPEYPRQVRGLSNFYSPIYGPTDDASIDSAKLTALFKQIRTQNKRPTTIQLAPLDTDSSFFTAAPKALRDAGWITDDYFCFGNWFAELAEPGFENYFAERSSQVRNTVTRARKKLDKDPSFHIAVLTTQGPALEQAIEDFTAVYNDSWKKPEPFPVFIPSLCRSAADMGWLRLGILKLDGQAVAAQLWLVSSGTAYIVKLAYRQEYAKRTVGSVLTAHLMQHVIDTDSVRTIDYLIGDDSYKRDWTPLRRERRGIVAFNRSHLRGLAAAAKHFSGRQLKRIRTNRPSDSAPQLTS